MTGWLLVLSFAVSLGAFNAPLSPQLFREVRIMKLLNHPNIGELEVSVCVFILGVRYLYKYWCGSPSIGANAFNRSFIAKGHNMCCFCPQGLGISDLLFFSLRSEIIWGDWDREDTLFGDGVRQRRWVNEFSLMPLLHMHTVGSLMR